MTGHGRAKMNTNRIGNTRFKNGTHCGLLSGDVSRDYPKQVASPIKSRKRTAKHEATFSLEHKNTITLTQRLLFLSGIQTRRAQVGDNGPLARIQESTSSEQSPRFVHDSKTASHVSTRSRPVFLTTHEGDIRAAIVETIMLLFLTKATSPTVQELKHMFCFSESRF